MNQIREIAKKFIAGKASLAEKRLLHQWYDEYVLADKEETVHLLFAEEADEVRQRLYQTLLARIKAHEEVDTMHLHPKNNIGNIRILRRIASISVVASIVIAFIGYLYYLSAHREIVPSSNEYTVNQEEINEDASPGGNKALLRLANGLEIPL